MTDKNRIIAWRGMSFLWLTGFVAMFAMAMMAFNDRDKAREIRASLGVNQLICRPAMQAGKERQLSPHEQDNTPTPAQAPASWNEERYSL